MKIKRILISIICILTLCGCTNPGNLTGEGVYTPASAMPEEIPGVEMNHDGFTRWYLTPDGTLVVGSERTMISSYGKREEYPWYENRLAIKRVEIVDGITEIPGYAFADCSNMESVYIPESVEAIKLCCFHRCSSLKSVDLPTNLNEVQYFTFSDCASLESVKIPSTLKVMNNYMFSGCTSLKEVTIEPGVETLGYDVFDGCTSLETIYLPKSVKLIDLYSFKDTEVKSVYYEGSENDLTAIDIKEGNSELLSALVYCNGYQPK